jgi:hypothetical protein
MKGCILLAQREFDAARSLLEQTLATQVETLTECHPCSMVTRYVLGLVLWEQGDLEGARGEIERALRLQSGHLAEQHPDTLNSKQALAQIEAALEKQGRKRSPSPSGEGSAKKEVKAGPAEP